MITKTWNKLISIIDTPVWLEVFFVVIILLRIPSFFEPYYYGDEMIYLTLGEGIRQGVPLYSGLHDNKPPLLYLTAAIAGNLFVFKVLLAAFNLLAVYLFWKLVKSLFGENKRLQFISTVIFGLFTTLPLLEGNIANAENFMMVPTLLAMNYIFSKKDSFKNIFYAGLAISIASLFKIVAAFDILAIIVFWFVYTDKKSFIVFVKKVLSLSTGFIIPIGLSFVWALVNGSVKEYLEAAFMQNIGYVSSWRASDIEEPFLTKNAPLLIRFAIMTFGFGILWMLKKKLSKPFLFVSAWLLATLFAVTLSERPYPHYLLQSVAPATILFSILLTANKIEQVYTIIPLTIFAFVPFFFKFWYYPTTTYYLNFIKLATNQIDKNAYFDHFSENTKTNYSIAEFLKNSLSKNDKVFVWSNDSSAIYSLSRRLPPTKYVADYHFIDFSSKEETLNRLSETLPKFVVISSNAYPFPELDSFVQDNYYIISEIGKSQIWLSIKSSK